MNNLTRCHIVAVQSVTVTVSVDNKVKNFHFTLCRTTTIIILMSCFVSYLLDVATQMMLIYIIRNSLMILFVIDESVIVCVCVCVLHRTGIKDVSTVKSVK